MFQTKVLEKKIHILCSVTVLQKSCCLLDNVEKYSRTAETPGDNMAHGHFMLGA